MITHVAFVVTLDATAHQREPLEDIVAFGLSQAEAVDALMTTWYEYAHANALDPDSLTPDQVATVAGEIGDVFLNRELKKVI